ncbi:heparan-alpha-glucosaminide N-acetyltransferase domain-containing protein [Ornithinimicrobium sp. LYQ103]|uniref:heparan-alpha-glucosaminide N-acetyltransferase domain-containing protein n=1 Tax=Ornithinimicrobium sp. LYQ103 TaxID=3378796 RepID=UPI003852F662
MTEPLPGAARIVAVDLARMLALLGMFAAHLLSPLDETRPGGVDPVFELVAGRSSALFAVLAGVSIALTTRSAREDPGRHRLRLIVRATLVALLGLVLGLLNSGVAVILTFYGVLFLCALPVLTWRARPLALLALAWGLASPVLSLAVRDELGPPAYVVPSLLSLTEPGVLLRELLLTGYYPVLTWATYLFAGMAIGRLDLRARAWGPRLALGGAFLAVLGLAVSAWVTRTGAVRSRLTETLTSPTTPWADVARELRTGLYGTHPTGSWWWLGVWSPHSGSIVDLAHTTGTAMLVLGLALVVVRGVRGVPWSVVAGAGAMTLTLYVTHVVVLASALGVRGGLALVVHSTAAVGIGALFAAGRVKGPMESGVTSATRLVPVRERREP